LLDRAREPGAARVGQSIPEVSLPSQHSRRGQTRYVRDRRFERDITRDDGLGALGANHRGTHRRGEKVVRYVGNTEGCSVGKLSWTIIRSAALPLQKPTGCGYCLTGNGVEEIRGDHGNACVGLYIEVSGT